MRLAGLIRPEEPPPGLARPFAEHQVGNLPRVVLDEAELDVGDLEEELRLRLGVNTDGTL